MMTSIQALVAIFEVWLRGVSDPETDARRRERLAR